MAEEEKLEKLDRYELPYGHPQVESRIMAGRMSALDHIAPRILRAGSTSK